MQNAGFWSVFLEDGILHNSCLATEGISIIYWNQNVHSSSFKSWPPNTNPWPPLSLGAVLISCHLLLGLPGVLFRFSKLSMGMNVMM
jgi:hypothetical protein